MSYPIDKTTYDKAAHYSVGHGYATRPSPPTAIVVHSTEGAKGQSLESAANYLYTSPDVSSDYLIGKQGEIIQFLDSRKYQAWHAGGEQKDGSWTAQAAYSNPHSIGIECLHASGETWPAVQKDALAWLLNELVRAYAIAPTSVESHGQIAIDGPYIRKKDPTNWPHADFIAWRDAVLMAAPARYMALGVPVYQRQDCTGPLWGHLNQDEIVTVDAIYSGQRAHLADGRGFIKLDASVAVLP